MRIFRKVALIGIVCLLAGYMLFAIFVVDRNVEDRTICHAMSVKVNAGKDIPYFDSADIEAMIEDAGLNPIGGSMAEIGTWEIEDLLHQDRSIRKAECYKTVDGVLKIEVWQRTPLMRVMSNTGDYYLDNEGEVMPVPKNLAVCVALASGFIDEDYARNELYRLALYLREHKEWRQEIEQIYVHRNKDIEIVPRKGDHRVLVGRFEDFEDNLKKLPLFYEKGLDKIGWNRYSLINLKYKDRVICTKK